jgi:CDP-diacylglycerol pyrophosphatase
VIGRWAAAALCAALAFLDPAVAAADSNALWRIVHDQCVPDQQAHGDPQPCALVDARGYAVLKDLVGNTQYLLLPTARISGIESPELLAPGAVNYFAAAWQARSFVDERAGLTLPRDWVSLAVNSATARTQDQLHIHIDCVDADVKDTLTQHLSEVGPNWAPLAEPLAGHAYLARTVPGEDLGADPFRLVADTGVDMAGQTIVVVGAYLAGGQPGFVVLTRGPAEGPAAGEELQDHDHCPPRFK